MRYIPARRQRLQYGSCGGTATAAQTRPLRASMVKESRGVMSSTVSRMAQVVFWMGALKNTVYRAGSCLGSWLYRVLCEARDGETLSVRTWGLSFI